MDYTKFYDESLLEIGGDEQPDGSFSNGNFTYFKQMLPWIGIDYDKGTFKKLILIGESHYLPKNANEELFNPRNWYHEDHTDWYKEGEEEEQMTNTRQFLAGYLKCHRMYNNPHKVMLEVMIEQYPEFECKNLYRYVVYYNYFLRPARNKKSIKDIIKTEDRTIASDTLLELATIIKPDYVFFLSKFAWESFMSEKKTESLPFIIGYSDHPSRRWNVANSYNGNLITSKECFKQFLIKNKIFEKQ